VTDESLSLHREDIVEKDVEGPAGEDFRVQPAQALRGLANGSSPFSIRVLSITGLPLLQVARYFAGDMASS
jgi:hypothetical protein